MKGVKSEEIQPCLKFDVCRRRIVETGKMNFPGPGPGPGLGNVNGTGVGTGRLEKSPAISSPAGLYCRESRGSRDFFQKCLNFFFKYLQHV
jgi:hypothetical protein